MDEERNRMIPADREGSDREPSPDTAIDAPDHDLSPAPGRRSRFRPFFWLLLIAALVVAAIWYFPRTARNPGPGRFGESGAMPSDMAARIADGINAARADFCRRRTSRPRRHSKLAASGVETRVRVGA